jgi:predicted AAA+ superfamily ATPase
LSHYRTHTGQEIDIILESGLQIVGIEVKSSSQLTADHFKGLRYLQSVLGNRFHRGLILYTGHETMLLEDNIWAVPISALWGK